MSKTRLCRGPAFQRGQREDVRPEKTVVDCFRFRNKLGVDVAVDALSRLLKKGRAKRADILYFARLCRVERVMRPYLEALLGGK